MQKTLFDKILKIKMSGRKTYSRFERVIELFNLTMQFSNFSFVCFLLSIVFVMSLTKIIMIRKKCWSISVFGEVIVWRSFYWKTVLYFFYISYNIRKTRFGIGIDLSLKEKLRASSHRSYFKHFENYVYLVNQIKKKIKTYLTGH